jgi:hypothetical protein
MATDDLTRASSWRAQRDDDREERVEHLRALLRLWQDHPALPWEQRELHEQLIDALLLAGRDWDAQNFGEPPRRRRVPRAALRGRAYQAQRCWLDAGLHRRVPPSLLSRASHLLLTRYPHLAAECGLVLPEAALAEALEQAILWNWWHRAFSWLQDLVDPDDEPYASAAGTSTGESAATAATGAVAADSQLGRHKVGMPPDWERRMGRYLVWHAWSQERPVGERDIKQFRHAVWGAWGAAHPRSWPVRGGWKPLWPASRSGFYEAVQEARYWLEADEQVPLDLSLW